MGFLAWLANDISASNAREGNTGTGEYAQVLKWSK